MDKEEKHGTAKNPREGASFFSIMTFSWIIKTLCLGYRRDLEVSDLYVPLDEHKSSILGDRIVNVWDQEQERCDKEKKNSHPSLLKVLWKLFGLRIVMIGLIQAILELIRVAQPLMLAKLLHYFSKNSDTTKNMAYMWASGVIICSFVKLGGHLCIYDLTHVGMKIRIACCSLVYRKILRLSNTALTETTVGQIVNLLSNDVNRFDNAVYFMNYIWLGPLQSVLITYFIYQEVGWPAVVGMACLLMFVPLQGYLGRKSNILRMKIAPKTDVRLRLINEIINGIQVIKMYTWEKPFSRLVEKARSKEVHFTKKNSIIKGIIIYIDMFTTRLALFLMILSYVLLGNHITSEKIFMMTSFYSALRMTMTIALPTGSMWLAQALVSIKRLEHCMMQDEVQKKPSTDLPYKVNESSTPSAAISIIDATVKWSIDDNENCLANFNMNVKPGKLVTIIGQVGSGKTSLLHAILGELPLLSGKLEINGKVVYASQEPWIFASSLRQNILFGRPMDKVRYDKVVGACQLHRDFAQLPHGDRTLVGERGISLSGGQRSRVNLARAMYAEADIYLLDDPLSAVDPHVGKHMFEECIDGYLRGKTRILVTHQLQYLKAVDHIIVMNNGSVQAEGTLEELRISGTDIVKMLEQTNEAEDKNRVWKRSHHSSIESMHLEEGNRAEPAEVEEMRSSSSISGQVYVSYFKAAGSMPCVSMMCIIFVLNHAAATGGDCFIAYWVNAEEKSLSYVNDTVVAHWDDALSPDLYVYLYSTIIAANVILTFGRIYTFSTVCMRSSKKLHANMFNTISRATMLFFNRNTSGRILNRFSKDMGVIDEMLPLVIGDVIHKFSESMGAIIIVSVVNPWLIIPTVFIGYIFHRLRIFYIGTSRSVKRLEGTTRSPVFSHLNATMLGLTTVRSFAAEIILTKEFDSHQDLHSSASFIFLSSSRAFGVYLEFINVVYAAIVIFSFLVLSHETFGGSMGLVITQCLGLMDIFQWAFRQAAEMENYMTSVERVVEYSQIEKESPLESDQEKKPSEDWPAQGRLEFRNMYLRYDRNNPPVLKNLNFVIMPGEKVGIVGRTGAGKSSLISALFRLAPIDGDVYIDKVPTSSIGLHDLRSKISIIPQEPVLFSGSLRKNLDPFDEYPDDRIWQALHEVELGEVVSELPVGLHSDMYVGGANFSVGQRQLVCLARAIVKNNKILVLDEATANVDLQTDALIQKTIRRTFSDSTVLTIAHRLNTIVDSDKVLVMDAGTIVEFDHPHILLQNKQGFLRRMVEESGKTVAKTLTKVAEESYLKREST